MHCLRFSPIAAAALMIAMMGACGRHSGQDLPGRIERLGGHVRVGGNCPGRAIVTGQLGGGKITDAVLHDLETLTGLEELQLFITPSPMTGWLTWNN